MTRQTFPKVSRVPGIPSVNVKVRELVGGELVLDQRALEHRSNQGTLRMDPVRAISVDKIVEIVYGEGPGIQRARFVDLSGGWLRTRGASRELGAELQRLIGPVEPPNQDEAMTLQREAATDLIGAVAPIQKKARTGMWIWGTVGLIGLVLLLAAINAGATAAPIPLIMVVVGGGAFFRYLSANRKMKKTASTLGSMTDQQPKPPSASSAGGKRMSTNQQFCSNCGTERRPGAGFCVKCGTKVVLTPEPPVAASLSCPNCGTDASQDDEFCIRCGTKLPGAVSTPGIVPASAPTSAFTQVLWGMPVWAWVAIGSLVSLLAVGGVFLLLRNPESQDATLPAPIAGTATIGGILTVNGEPRADEEVRLGEGTASEDGDATEEGEDTRPLAMTAADGSFVFQSVDPGDYSLSVGVTLEGINSSGLSWDEPCSAESFQVLNAGLSLSDESGAARAGVIAVASNQLTSTNADQVRPIHVEAGDRVSVDIALECAG